MPAGRGIGMMPPGTLIGGPLSRSIYRYFAGVPPGGMGRPPMPFGPPGMPGGPPPGFRPPGFPPGMPFQGGPPPPGFGGPPPG